jgi:hypothetical protein
MGVAVGAPEPVESDATMKSWRLHKGRVTTLMLEKAEDGTFGNPLDSRVWKFQCATGAINLALKEVVQSMDVGVPLVQLYINPKSAMATHSWSVGELALAPTTCRIEKGASAMDIPCGKFDLGGPVMEALHIAPMFTPLHNATMEPNKTPWVCPVWYITAAAKDQKLVMTLKAVTKIVRGHTVKVPVMVNLKDIDPSVELTWGRGACKSVLASRAVVTASTFQAVAKRRGVF